MKKQTYVSKTFSFPLELFEEFILHCNDNNYNRSAVVQDLVEQWLKQQKAAK